MALPRYIDDLPWMKCVEEVAHFVELEFRISGLDDEEKLVARGLVESPHVEHRVIRHRQSVEGEHAEHGAECGQKNRAFEDDGDERRPGVVRLAADVERI